MRRFVGLAALLFFSIPFGLSVTGCGHKAAPVQYCYSGNSGPVVGQVASITLSPTLATTGESLNYGQIGQQLSASALDCKGNVVSVRSFTFASTSSFTSGTVGSIFADINPSNGQVCGGNWNRNVGGGIPDYTTCVAPTTTPRASTPLKLTTPTAASATTASTTSTTLASVGDPVSGTLTLAVGTGPSVPSHSISVAAGSTLATLASQINNDATFQAEGITAVYNASTLALTISGPVGLSNTLVTTNTALIDNTAAFVAYVTATAEGTVSNAIPVYVHPVVTGIVLGGATPAGSCPTSTSGGNDPGTDCGCTLNTSGSTITAPVYNGSSCISQNTAGQLVARVYRNGTTNPADNITCQVGHLSFAPLNAANVVTIDQNGIATAQQPGSAVITATVANSSTASNAGFFSTCPPASISLTVPGQPGANSIAVAVNNLQPLTAVVTDQNNHTITGLTLEFNSTSPQTIPATVGSVTPIYPGSATITAVCQPGSCNPSPFSQIGLYGNGKPITSNGITVNVAGTSSTVLYMGSTQSQYLQPIDFTTSQPSALIKLPYVPNSMVITQNGSAIYLGSNSGLMSISTATNSQSGVYQSIPGNVLAVSNDGSTLVVSDPVRQVISLVATANGGVSATNNGIGTRAEFSPDDQTVYITTTTGSLLTHTAFNSWQITPLTGQDALYSDVAVTVPSVGAYFAGKFTEGRSYCSNTTLSGTTTPQTATNAFYPLADESPAQTDRLTATTNGQHIIGATAATVPATLSDLTVTSLKTTSACPAQVAPGYFVTTTQTAKPLTGTAGTVNATQITSVVASSNSAAAFVTYAGTSGLLPFYIPATTGAGTLSLLQLGNGATAAAAPISGVFSTDNLTFYAGTSGGTGDSSSADNDVHMITMTYPAAGLPTAKETGILSPNLPAFSGTGVAPVDLLAQKAKKSTS